MSESSEPTIIEYARFHGLIKDHQCINLLTLSSDLDSWPDLLEEPNESANIESLQASLANEKLAISKEAATLLLSCTTAPDIGTWDNEQLLGISTHAYKQKLDVPILLTDHELDVQRFGQRTEPDLASFNLPYERIDEEHDEGFTWPAEYYVRHEGLDAQCTGEKIGATRDVLFYLQGALEDSYTDEDGKAMWKGELGYTRNRVLEPVTPPLLPASPVIVPFIPSSPTCHLELLSDHTSPTAAQAAEVEDLLMRDDAIKPNRKPSRGSNSSRTIPLEEADIGEIYSPLKDIGEPPSSPWPKHMRPDDRKVEGPLTPPMMLHNPMTKGKNVSFKEMLQEVIPYFPPLIEDPTETSLQDIDAFFEETIAPIADRVNREVEQEQLQEADSTRRATVPIMDFSLPMPPWKVYGRGAGAAASDGGSELVAQKRLLVEVKETHLKDYRWPGAASLELKLRWTPFPKELGQIATEESIDDDGSLHDFLAELDITDTVDSSNLTWKREGLRVLDDAEDSEEELQPGVFSEGKTIAALIKKRRLEIEESFETSPTSNFGDVAGQGVEPTNRVRAGSDDNLRDRRRTDLPGPSEATIGQPLLGGAFSAFSALSNFMDVRGGTTKKQKLTDSPFFPSPTSNRNSVNHPPTKPTAPTHPTSIHEPTKETFPPIPIPIPALTPLPPSHTFITSTSTLPQRRILRLIQHHHPNATFIERDFRPPTTTKPHPNKPHGHGHGHGAPPQPPTDEADLILSSSTGLLWTTTQAIKQLPLPGQGPATRRPPIRERIARVCERYERLVVLVSEGRETGSNLNPQIGSTLHEAAVVSSIASSALNPKDADALTALTAFCTALDAAVSVLYVAGGEDELAWWIAGLMGRYSIGVGVGFGGSVADADSEATKLLQDETSWEIFLRRAGMNAYAAQEVLVALKPPLDMGDGQGGDGGTGGGCGEFGLVAFVRMGAEERIRRFEGLLGGRRVLGRVSARLDVLWG